MIEPKFDATRLTPVAKPLQTLSKKFFAPLDAARNKAAEEDWEKNPKNPKGSSYIPPVTTGQKAYRTRSVNAFKTAHDAFYAKDKKGNQIMTRETHPAEYSNIRQLWDKSKQVHQNDPNAFKAAMGGRRPHLPPPKMR